MTIKDIANECGVAVGTVSRVLNNHPDVSDKTRKKVQEVVDKYGFILNQNAKQLKTQDNKTILILIKGSSSMMLNALLEDIQKRLEPLPYITRVIVLDEYDNEAQKALVAFYEQKPIGIIFLGGNPELYTEDFSKVKCPCVLISNRAENLENENLSSVSTDDQKAAEYIGEYIVSKGHKKIGILGGDVKVSDMSDRRYRGFLNALKKQNINFDYNNSYITAKYSFESGAEAAKEMLEKNPDVTAIFCMSDVMAIGACRQLKTMGYEIPEQISIAGFDGLPIAEFYCPRITTIRQIIPSLAETGLSTLLDSIEGKNPSCHKMIPFQFVEGESVKNLLNNQ